MPGSKVSDAGSPRALLVTGGTRGIGAAIAARAVRAGYAVCLTYASDAESASRTARALAGAGGRVTAVRADVADPGAVVRALDHAEKELGNLSAVVNNAGVTGPLGPFTRAAVEDMRRVLEVNVLGALLVCQEATRRWEGRGCGGAIVNISSVAASTGAPGEYVAYAASKAAVETMTLGLARELAGRAIRVNAVAPGTVATGIHAAAGDAGRPARVALRVPMGRVGEPEEIANAVVWLLSDEASYVTGAVLRVTGG